MVKKTKTTKRSSPKKTEKNPVAQQTKKMVKKTKTTKRSSPKKTEKNPVAQQPELFPVDNILKIDEQMTVNEKGDEPAEMKDGTFQLLEGNFSDFVHKIGCS